MARIRAEYPYDDYYMYLYFNKDMGRRVVIMTPINPETHSKTTISYARYLMSVKEGRILEKDEHVDHIDNDRTNDDINNLQILSQKENNIKAAKHRGKKMAEFRCPWCGKVFSKARRESHLVRHGKRRYTCCSKRCAGKFSTLEYYHTDDSYVYFGLAMNVLREYVAH